MARTRSKRRTAPPAPRPGARRPVEARRPLSWRVGQWAAALWRLAVAVRSYWVLAIVAVAALFRFIRIESTPVFIDEDGYTLGALIVGQLPWPDGILNATWLNPKPPLAMVLQSLLSRPLGDPVLAGRVLSALAGTITTALCFFLGRRLAGPSVGLATAALYALSPLAVLHERLILLDGPMVASLLAAALAGWIAVERGSWRLAMLATVLGALAVQFKPPGIVAAGLPLLYWALCAWWRFDRLGPTIVAAVGPVVSYAALMTSPIGTAIAYQNNLLMRSNPMGANLELVNQELEAFPYVQVYGSTPVHLDHLRDAILTYFPGGLALLIPAGVVLAMRQNARLAGMFLAILIALCLPWPILSRFAPSRYYLPAVPFACALAAVALVRLTTLARSFQRPAGLATGVIATAPILASSWVSWQIAASFSTAPLTRPDNWQYRSGSVSGCAYAEAAQSLRATAQPGSAVAYALERNHLIAVGSHRPLPAGVRSLGAVDPRNPLPTVNPGPLYVVIDDFPLQPIGQRREQLQAAEPRLETVAHFRRPGSEAGVYVLRLVGS